MGELQVHRQVRAWVGAGVRTCVGACGCVIGMVVSYTPVPVV